MSRNFIYKISNQIDDKLYIGITYDIQKRWQGHLNASRSSRSKPYNSPLYVAMREYGQDKFKIEVIEEGAGAQYMNTREQYWIQKLSTKWPDGYNLYHKPLTDAQCKSIEEDEDYDGGYSVYVYTSSLNDEIFAIEVGKRSYQRHFHVACRKTKNVSTIIKTIQSIWEQDGKVIVKRARTNLEEIEAHRFKEILCHNLKLKQVGNVLVRRAQTVSF